MSMQLADPKQLKGFRENLQKFHAPLLAVFSEYAQSNDDAEQRTRRMMALAFSEAQTNPSLLRCTPQSVLRSLLVVTQMGLSIGGDEAYLIGYGKDCTVVPGYQGLVTLAANSGFMRSINYDVICIHDDFKVKGQGSFTHVRSFNDPECQCRHDPKAFYDNVQGAWVEIELTTGGAQRTLMDWQEINSVRSGREGFGWQSYPWRMSAKTVLRRALRTMPKRPDMSPDLMKAIVLNDRADKNDPMPLRGLEFDIPEELEDAAPQDN